MKPGRAKSFVSLVLLDRSVRPLWRLLGLATLYVAVIVFYLVSTNMAEQYTALAVSVLFIAVIFSVHMLILRSLWKGSLLGAIIGLLAPFIAAIMQFGSTLGAEPMIASVLGILTGTIGMLLGAGIQAAFVHSRKRAEGTRER